MAKHPLSKREEKRELHRRALIKWSVAAGAALGVSRSKILILTTNRPMQMAVHVAKAITVGRIVSGRMGMRAIGG